MNEILKKLEIIRQDKENLQVEYNTRLEAVHQEYRARLETNNKRYESFYFVAEELGLLNESQSNDGASINEEKLAIEPNQENVIQTEEREKENRHPAQKYILPIGDAVEQILRQFGMPMSLQELRFHAAKLGVTPTSSTFRSAVSKDHRKRFERVSDGVYKLRGVAVPDDYIQSDSLFNTTNFPKLDNGNGQGNHKFVMKDELKKIVPEADGKEFDANWIFDVLLQRFPTEISEDKRQSAIATLTHLMQEGYLVRIQRGKDKAPPIFQENKNFVLSESESDKRASQVEEIMS